MLKGNKYMLRTDVMYRRMEPAALAQFDAEQRAALWSQDPALLHLRPKELAPRIAARLGLAVGDRKPKAVIEEAMRQLSLSPPARSGGAKAGGMESGAAGGGGDGGYLRPRPPSCRRLGAATHTQY